MSSWTAENAECNVYSFKEGLLSAVGHDVKLRVTDFELSVEPRGPKGVFEAGSLEVVCAMSDGRENPGALSDSDRATIEGYVRGDILQSDEHPEIVWETTSLRRVNESTLQVEGRLTLHGRTKPVKAKVEAVGDRWVTRVRIRQPDFGIKPFKALMGALKIKPVVEVKLSVPRSGTEDLGA